MNFLFGLQINFVMKYFAHENNLENLKCLNMKENLLTNR